MAHPVFSDLEIADLEKPKIASPSAMTVSVRCVKKPGPENIRIEVEKLIDLLSVRAGRIYGQVLLTISSPRFGTMEIDVRLKEKLLLEKAPHKLTCEGHVNIDELPDLSKYDTDPDFKGNRPPQQWALRQGVFVPKGAGNAEYD